MIWNPNAKDDRKLVESGCRVIEESSGKHTDFQPQNTHLRVVTSEVIINSFKALYVLSMQFYNHLSAYVLMISIIVKLGVKFKKNLFFTPKLGLFGIEW